VAKAGKGKAAGVTTWPKWLKFSGNKVFNEGAICQNFQDARNCGFATRWSFRIQKIQIHFSKFFASRRGCSATEAPHGLGG